MIKATDFKWCKTQDELEEATRLLKGDCVDWLLSFDYEAVRAIHEQTDKRLVRYIETCISNPDEHNMYELLALKRFLQFHDKYDFKVNKVRKFIFFYEHLSFPSPDGLACYRMTPVQVFQTACIFGWYYRGEEGKRVCREALLFVPRKFSKTTFVAGVACFELLYGDANAQGFVGANSYNQAKICFDIIRGTLGALDAGMRRFRINREQITSLQPSRSAYLRCLSTSPAKLDGLNASLVIMDEYAQSPTADLKNVLTSSMGARKNPLTIIITTASNKRDTPFYANMQDIYKPILRGEVENDDIFAHLFEPDPWDNDDAPSTWRKVQPHLGVTVKEDFYEHEWRNAALSSDVLREFRNKYLNIFAIDENKVWITPETISNASAEETEEVLKGFHCVSAVDLSVKDDFSAVTYLFYSPQRMYKGRNVPFHSVTEYYLPEAVLDSHPNRELYKQWVEKGYLKICGGEVIDYRAIANDMLCKPYRNFGIGYDPAHSKDFIRIMESAPNVGAGYLYPIRQNYMTFTALVEMLDASVANGKITFDANPITGYCFRNVVMDEDRHGLKKPIKGKATDKIDGVITNLMCFWLFDNVKVLV